MKKQNKGITLVALVITIIILLILAGISISALTGSGLFQKAEDAVNKYGNAQNQENSILGEYEEYIDNLGKENNYKKIKEVATSETTPYYPDSSSKIIENSNLDIGLVVADKNNNEWVWIVVPKSVTASATTDKQIEDELITYAGVYREGANFTDEWYAMDEETFVYASQEGLTDAQKELNNGCGLTYSKYNEAKSKMLQSIKANGGFWISRYEAGIEGSVQNPSLARTEEGELTASSPKAVSKPDHIPYNFVTCSQAQNLASKMSSNTTKTSSLLFGIQWDLVCKYLKEKNALTIADIKEDSKNWGNYHNSTLNITSLKAMGELCENYTLEEWENITEKPVNSKILLTTGASTDTKKMNIYDFAGNVAEWILEKTPHSNSPCIHRGGSYNYTGSWASASERFGDITSSNIDYIGLRVSLY